MSLLEELNIIITGCNLPVETGVFSDTAPDEYVVITPLADTFEAHADNRPQAEIQAARLSLYVKGSYIKQKNAIIHALLGADFIITDRRYIEYEAETGYYHYIVDTSKHYRWEE